MITFLPVGVAASSPDMLPTLYTTSITVIVLHQGFASSALPLITPRQHNILYFCHCPWLGHIAECRFGSRKKSCMTCRKRYDFTTCGCFRLRFVDIWILYNHEVLGLFVLNNSALTDFNSYLKFIYHENICAILETKSYTIPDANCGDK